MPSNNVVLPKWLWQAAFLLNLGPEIYGLLVTHDIVTIMLFVIFSVCVTIVTYLLEWLVVPHEGTKWLYVQ